MDIEAPVLARAPVLEPVAAGGRKVERALVYAPDAIGRSFLEQRPELLARLTATSDVVVPLRSMLPPKTPVCFASMLTGAQPEAHGITRTERRLLQCDTLFDAMVRAGKKTAIVAVRGCSIDILFRNRSIDYFSEDYDAGVVARTRELLERGEHECIVAYNQEYDDALHETAPDSPMALDAACRHVEAFVLLCQAVEEHWARYSRAVLFAPDHGAHFDPAKGKGDHGEDIPEDMELVHFWRVRRAASPDSTERVRQAWDEASDAWEDFVESGKDWYRHGLHGRALLRACGNVRGSRVLDMGCGQGFFSRQLAQAGAEVVGVDLSERQVANAARHEREKPLGIEYIVMDATQVADRWGEGSFDMVTACMSLHDMPEPGRALKAAHRLLKGNGRCVFSAVHPVMDAPVRAWERDSSGRKTMYKIGRYFDEGPAVCHWYMARLDRYWTTPIVRLTIDGWSRLAAEAGFLIRRIYEPRPSVEDLERWPALDDCRDFPSFVILDLVKPA